MIKYDCHSLLRAAGFWPRTVCLWKIVHSESSGVFIQFGEIISSFFLKKCVCVDTSMQKSKKVMRRYDVQNKSDILSPRRL